MAPAPDLVLLSMAALIGGLVIFAGLLLLGTRIVRWLGLVPERKDLPEGPRFEPPPPPPVARPDRAAAGVVAAAQARLRSLYAEAHAVVSAGLECQALHHQVVAAGQVSPFVEVVPVTERCSATAVASATAVEKALSSFDQRLRTDRTAIGEAEITALRQEISAHALSAQGALTQARAAVAPLPDGGNRRLIVLVVMLVVMIAWVIAMQFLLKK
jgi:hypothetical protein